MVGKKKFQRFVVLSVISLLLLASLVLAARVVFTGALASRFNFNETISNVYTIHINNTYVTVNVTQVNITLPTNVTFVGWSNGTSAGVGAHVFFNSSTVLTWNSTINGLISNMTNGDRQNFTLNATVSRPGTYNITIVTSNSTAATTETSYLTLVVNDTAAATAVQFDGHTPINNTNSSGAIPINITTTDNGRYTVNVTLFNSTGIAINGSVADDGKLFINFTGLTKGVYYYNVTVNDSGANSNYSETRKITIDTEGPTVSLALVTSTVSTLELTITTADNHTMVPATCSSGRTGASIVVDSATKQTITEIGLLCNTAYAYTVTCIDQVGNTGTSAETSFSTGACNGGGSSGGGGGGGSTVSWSNTFVVPAGADLNAGYSKELVAKQKLEVKVLNIKHNVGVVSISGSSAIIEVSSTPQQVTMNVGETKKFDVNADGTYDLSVTLASITDGKANVTLKAISEKVVTTGTGSDEGADSGAGDSSEEAGSSKALVWIILLIVVVALVAWLLMRKKR